MIQAWCYFVPISGKWGREGVSKGRDPTVLSCSSAQEESVRARRQAPQRENSWVPSRPGQQGQRRPGRTGHGWGLLTRGLELRGTVSASETQQGWVPTVRPAGQPYSRTTLLCPIQGWPWERQEDRNRSDFSARTAHVWAGVSK